MAASLPCYEAFISYRHASADTATAKRIQRALEGFRIPKALRQGARCSLGKLFRDADELPASASLTDEISRALCDSGYLIVICSPDTPSSNWVDLEIEEFLTTHGPDRILAVLVAGEPEQSFPAALLNQTEKGHEPLAADFRPGKTRREIRREELRLAAALIGCGLDDLVNRRRTRALQIGATAACCAAALGSAFGVFSFWQQYQIASANRALQVSQSEYLASESLKLLENGYRMEAIQVAASALPQTEDASDRPLVASAQNALSEALGVYPTNLLNWHPIYSIDGLSNPGAYAASVEGNWIAACASPQYVNVYNLETGVLLGHLAAPSETSFTDTLLPAGQNVACIMADNSIVAYDAQTGKQSWTFKHPVVTAECAEDESVIAILTVDNSMSLEIAIVSTERGDVIFSTPLSVGYSGDECLGLSEDFRSAAVVSDNSLILADFATQSTRSAPYSGPTASSVLVSDQIYVTGTPPESAYATHSNTSEGTVTITGSTLEATISAYAPDSLEQLWRQRVAWDLYVPDYADVPYNPMPNLVSVVSRGNEHAAALVLSAGNHILALDSSTGSILDDAEAEAPVVCVDAMRLSGEDVFLYTTFDGTRSFFAPFDPGFQTKDRHASWFKVPFSLAEGESVGNRFIACDAEGANRIAVFEVRSTSELPSYRSLATAAPNTMRVSETGYVAWISRDGRELQCVAPEGDRDKPATIELSPLGIDPAHDTLTLSFSSTDPSVLLVRREGSDETPPAIWAISVQTAELIASWTWDSEAPDFGFDSSWFSDERNGQLTVHVGTYLCTLEVPSLEVVNEFTGTGETPLQDDLLVGDFLLALWHWPEGGALSLHDPETNETIESALTDYYVSSNTTLDGYVACSDDGSLLAVACMDGMLRLFDLETLEWRWEVPFSSLASSFLLFSPDAGTLFVQDGTGMCSLIDVATGELLGQASDTSIGRCGVLSSGYFSDDGALVACRGMNLAFDHFVTVFDVSNGSCQVATRILDAQGVLSDDGVVILQSGEQIYTLPLYTHTELLDIAEEVTRGHELTPEERNLYHLD